MFLSERVTVVLITEDPMVEIAMRHLFGTELQALELHSTLTFQNMEGSLDWAEVRIVLADLSCTEDIDRLGALRKMAQGPAILGWCSEALMKAVGSLREHCDGIISRRASPSDLITALTNVSGKLRSATPQSPAREVNIRLTYREGQLLNLLQRGFRNKEIATCLGITTGTVKVYLSTLFKKTGAKDRFELTLFGMKNSLYGLAERSGSVPIPIAARRAISRPVLTSIRLVQPDLHRVSESGRSPRIT